MNCYEPCEHILPESAYDEPYPEGYLESLENCRALAVNLLEKAINGVDVKRCWDCSAWAGRCLKGDLNTIARDKACPKFSQRKGGDKP